MDTFTYFGYGSNMLTKKLKSRCPSAVKIDVCRTKEYTLKFHKVSSDDSGKGDMAKAESETDELYGVAFSIDKSEESNLDRAEGYGYGYDKKEIDVEGITKGPLRVWTYYATNINPELKPYHWYKGQTVDGAKEHDLPPDYIKKIEAFESIPDPDKERVDKETAYKSKSSSNSI